MYLLLCIIDKDQVFFFSNEGSSFSPSDWLRSGKKKVQKHFHSRFKDATENML